MADAVFAAGKLVDGRPSPTMTAERARLASGSCSCRSTWMAETSPGHDGRKKGRRAVRQSPNEKPSRRRREGFAKSVPGGASVHADGLQLVFAHGGFRERAGGCEGD